MLIEADYCWEIVTGRICRGRSGPIAIETKLGWVLSGPVPGYDQEHTSTSLFTAHVLQTEASEASLDDRLGIPRCWFQDLGGNMVHSLQGFCDASKDAYAAVVYLRSASSSGISVRFEASKTRVAPTKGHTIPRLVKLMSSVKRTLDPVVCLSKTSCFTDSMVVLFSIGFKEGGNGDSLSKTG